MVELLVFTILAAAGAIYAILPRNRQLRVQYCFGETYLKAALLGAVTIIVIHLIETYLSTANPTFSFFCGTICAPATFWLETTQVVVASSIAGFTLYRLWDPNPTIKRDEGLAKIVRSLYTEQDYDTLVSVVEDNYRKLVQQPEESDIPASRATTERVLLDSYFTEQYGKLNPNLGIKIIGDEQAEIPRDEFAKAFLAGLHKDESSILYHEIENNRNGEGSRYQIEPENKLLSGLFLDCSVAKDILAWKGIGDNTQKLLDELNRSTEDPYTNRDKRFTIMNDESPVFRDPLFVSVRFFDIMVTEALHQGVDHHMWIGYFDGFTEKICRNFEMGTHADPEREFPNDYSYILNEIFEVLIKLIEFTVDSPDEIRTNLERPDITHESDIIKTCIRNLFVCHYHVLRTDNIPSQFKQYLSDDVFGLYFKLAERQSEEVQLYKLVMRQHLLSDDPLNPIPSDGRDEYLQKFVHYLESYDTAELITMQNGYEEYQDLKEEIEEQLSQERPY